MNKYFSLTTLVLLTVSLACLDSNHPQQGNVHKRNPEQIFKELCSSCHGASVQTFVDRRWKHGNSRAELLNTITNGRPDNGMPSFAKALKKKEIEAMADYIVSNIANMGKFDAAKVNKPLPGTKYTSEGMSFQLEKVAEGLKSPWGMAFLPGGELLITDRNGKLYRSSSTGALQELSGGPEVVAEGQGGLLDVELHPQFAQNKLLYLSYSVGKKEGGKTLSSTAIVRARLEGNQLLDQKVIFDAQPYFSTRHHYGSRMEFGRDGYLYFSVGDRGMHFQTAQQLNSQAGKVHRIKDDGSIPADNPFVGQTDKMPSIYSYGHRNPQGLCMHPETGEIWTHEHGPRGGDEINIVHKANNYGWPTISYGINYDGTILTPKTAQEGMQQPLHQWTPSIGPSGMTFVKGDRYPAWKGNLLVGSLRFQYLGRCVIKDGKLQKEEILLQNIGRLRNVEMSPDGYIYVAVEDPGIIYRIVPN
jgi:glucose/arabinose dehydrogenase